MIRTLRGGGGDIIGALNEIALSGGRNALMRIGDELAYGQLYS